LKALLKINFTDFWAGFIKEDNYFYKLLSKHYDVVISEEPDLLFYSCYGFSYLEYNCIRIFYTAENVRPDFTGCDYAISFDHIKKKNHYRLPLYALYINHQYFSGSLSPKLEELTRVKDRTALLKDWEQREKFCCMIVSNASSKKRLIFFDKLSKFKHVDSGGAVLNNMGGELVKDKLTFIQDYKFVISFENAAYPGYVTEKLLEPLFMGCIPIYWGNPLVGKDFNTKRFLNYADFGSTDKLIKRIKEIDADPAEAMKIISEPIFPHNKVPEYILDENVREFFDKIVKSLKDTTPVATVSYKKKLHTLMRKKEMVRHIFLSKMGKYFR